MSDVPNRKDIIDSCPAEFRVELTEYIAQVESEVGEALVNLTITCLSDLGKIPEALSGLEDLARKLY